MSRVARPISGLIPPLDQLILASLAPLAFRRMQVIANASNTESPSARATVNFNIITNPSISGSNQNTFCIRRVTYSDAAWTTPLDSSVVAGSVTNQIAVTANVEKIFNLHLHGDLLMRKVFYQAIFSRVVVASLLLSLLPHFILPQG